MRPAHIALAVAAAVAGVTVLSTPNGAEDLACPLATSADARALYEQFAKALRQGDVEALTALYSPDAILMGPGAESIRLGHSEIAGYYTAFLKHRPAVAAVQRVVRTECASINVSGSETLAVATDATGITRTTLQAQYALTYARFGDAWLIVHHRQDTTEPLPSVVVPLANTLDKQLITGSNPPAAAMDIVLPPSPYELPASAPVIVSQRRPLLAPLESRVPIDLDLLAQAVALAARVPPPSVAAVSLPPAPFALEKGAPLIQALVNPQPPSDASPAMRTVVPALPFERSLAPPKMVSPPPVRAATPAQAPGQAPSQTPPLDRKAEVPERAFPEWRQDEPAPAPPTMPKAAPVKPAVAGFTQRATPVPPLKIEPKTGPKIEPKPEPRAAIVAPRPASPRPASKDVVKEPEKKSSKFLRWEDGVPLFDD